MSKQSMREEAERLIRETMEKRNLTVKQGNTRIEAVCGKCGAPNRLSAERGTACPPPRSYGERGCFRDDGEKWIRGGSPSPDSSCA
jgi:hypothetical protein